MKAVLKQVREYREDGINHFDVLVIEGIDRQGRCYNGTDDYHHLDSEKQSKCDQKVTEEETVKTIVCADSDELFDIINADDFGYDEEVIKAWNRFLFTID